MARRLLKSKGAAAAAALQHGAACRAWRTWLAYRHARRAKRQQVQRCASLSPTACMYVPRRDRRAARRSLPRLAHLAYYTDARRAKRQQV